MQGKRNRERPLLRFIDKIKDSRNYVKHRKLGSLKEY